MAAIAVSVLAKAVIMMTTVSGDVSRTAWSTSRPVLSPIWMSLITTSKSSFSTRIRASSTSAAVTTS